MTNANRRLSRKAAHSSAAQSGGALAGGVSAGFTRKVSVDDSGKAIQQLAIDVTGVQPPDRRYSADVVTCRSNGRDAVYLIFAQEKLTGGLRSMITVKMYADPLRQFMETLPQLRAFLDKFQEKVALAPAERWTPTAEPEQTIALVANVVQSSFTGFEAEMRFFHVSPYALHRANQADADRIAIDPVVQVDLPTGMLLTLFQQLDEIVVNLPRGDQ